MDEIKTPEVYDMSQSAASRIQSIVSIRNPSMEITVDRG
jgi:hypothetical protein